MLDPDQNTDKEEIHRFDATEEIEECSTSGGRGKQLQEGPQKLQHKLENMPTCPLLHQLMLLYIKLQILNLRSVLLQLVEYKLIILKHQQQLLFSRDVARTQSEQRKKRPLGI